MAKDPALNANEREDALPFPIASGRNPIQALGSEHVAEDVAPAGEMTKTAVFVARHELVPVAGEAIELHDHELLARLRISGDSPKNSIDGIHAESLANVSRTAVNRNSLNKRSNRCNVPRSPP